jgi:hypothetical protein
MKKLIVTILIALCMIMTSIPAYGYDEGFEATMDILAVRPVSLAATIVGSALFIVSLPFSIPSQSVGSTAQTLIVEPFNYTFTRPVGMFNGEQKRSKTATGEAQSPAVEKGPENGGSSNQ